MISSFSTQLNVGSDLLEGNVSDLFTLDILNPDMA